MYILILEIEKVSLEPSTDRIRHSTSKTWDRQRAEVERLKTVLDTKGIFSFNPMTGIPAEVLQNNYFKNSDLVHLTPEVDQMIASQTANALKEYYNSRWN